MRIAITGSRGLVGSALTKLALEQGHEIVRYVRPGAGGKVAQADFEWDPAAGTMDASGLAGCGAVVNLAGENIAAGRWTTALKRELRESRLRSTELLSKTLAESSDKPQCLVSASAIGFYGDAGNEVLTEQSHAGAGFLADLCQEWEQATQIASDAGIRVVNLRIGVVLSARGGALAKMLTPFKLGAGGIVGDGRQFWSWILLADLVRSILYCVETPALAGPVNAVSPNPMTNSDFTKTLASVLHRPALIPMPAFAAKLALGEMADHLLLCSARVTPQRLVDAGFEFTCPELEPALQAALSDR